MKYFQTAFRDFRNEMGLEPKCVPRLSLGSLLGTRWSAIGQVFPLFLVIVPEVFAKVNSAQVPSRFKVANEYRNVILPSKHRQRSLHSSKLFKM